MTALLPTRRSDPGLWERPRDHRGHALQPRNPRPMNGGKGGGGGGLTPNAQGYLERNGIWWPLQGTTASSPLMGGYGFGDVTADGVFHPGSDGNSGASCNDDNGKPCVAPCAGVVVARLEWDGSTPGEGRHLWCYLDDARAIAPCWMHWDHLGGFQCEEGQRFEAGQVLASCSYSGGWDCAHLHLELAKQPPASWWQWPVGWSLAQVEAAYYQPSWWFPASADKAGGMGGELPMDTTPEERAAMAPYFAMYGVQPNMETALMKRACLAYKRDESPGPCLTDEYPYGAYVRQDFTARTLEFHPEDGLVYYVELNLSARAAP